MGSSYIKSNAAEQSGLNKTGNAADSHPEGTHDDWLWALAAYASEQAEPTPSKPIARVM